MGSLADSLHRSDLTIAPSSHSDPSSGDAVAIPLGQRLLLSVAYPHLVVFGVGLLFARQFVPPRSFLAAFGAVAYFFLVPTMACTVMAARRPWQQSTSALVGGFVGLATGLAAGVTTLLLVIVAAAALQA